MLTSESVLTLKKNLFRLLVIKQDLERMIDRLNNFEERLFQTRETLPEKLSAVFPKNTAELLLELFTGLQFSLEDTEELKRWLAQFQAELKAIPVITVHIATELPETALSRISEWFWKQYSNPVILDFHKDGSLLGGVAIFQKGFYYDYSVRKTLLDMASRGDLQLSQLLS